MRNLTDEELDLLAERVAKKIDSPPSVSRRDVLGAGGLVGAAALLGGTGTASAQSFANDGIGRSGTSSNPLEQVNAEQGNFEAVDTEQVNSIRYIGAEDGESGLRSALSTSSYGDMICFSPGTSISVANGTLTIPEGVTLIDHKHADLSQSATLVKQFNGTLIEYNGNVSMKGLYLDGNASGGFTGDLLSPSGAGNRSIFLQEVVCDDAGSAAFVLNETYLSTFIGCQFTNSQDGVVVDGADHSPHNAWYRCRMGLNSRAGIDARQTLDRQSFNGCLIDGNMFGIDTERSSVGLPIPQTTSFEGCRIQSNDGPGIVLQGANAARVSLSLAVGVSVTGNAENPPAGLTSTNGVGDIHSENGGRIGGTISGSVGDMCRYNTDGTTANLTINGEAGDINLPGTLLTIMNNESVGAVTVQSGIGLDPTGGGSTITY